MIIRMLSGICGIVIIIMGIKTKNDKTGKYTTALKENYTDASIVIYTKGMVSAEIFFGAGMIVQAIFGVGIGYYIGTFISLLGIILLFVYMKKLKKRNVPYRKGDKR